MAVDTSVIGKPVAPSTIVLERGPASNFAKAVKDENPIFRDADAAKAAGFDNIPIPPTYAFAFANWGQFKEIQPEGYAEPSPVMSIIGGLMKTGGMVLHGEQGFTYHAPIVVGDTLHGTGVVKDVYEKTSSNGKVMTFVTAENEYRNQRGELVLTTTMTLLHRAG